MLRDPTLHGKTYELSGPDAYTFPEIAELLSTILGHEIKYVPVSPDDRRSALLENGISPWFAELLLSLDQFDARVVASRGTIEQMHNKVAGREAVWDKGHPGQIPPSARHRNHCHRQPLHHRGS